MTSVAEYKSARRASVAFGTTRVSRLFLAPRSARLSASVSGIDPLRVYVVRAGAIRCLAQSDGEGVWMDFHQSDFFVVAGAAEVPVQVLEASTVLEITLPAEVARGVRLSGAPVERLSVTSPLLGPIVAFAESTLTLVPDEFGSFTAYYLERLLQEMTMGLLVEVLTANVPVPSAPDAFTQALSIITAQHADVSLTSALIAGEIALSQRQLERIFQDHETTVGAEIRRARVDAAVRMLRDHTYDALSVGQIAQYVGYANGSALARAMSAEGLPSPRRVRTDD